MSPKTITRNFVVVPCWLLLLILQSCLSALLCQGRRQSSKAEPTATVASPGVPVDGYIVKPAVLKDELKSPHPEPNQKGYRQRTATENHSYQCEGRSTAKPVSCF
jgi:hypothetical protein